MKTQTELIKYMLEDIRRVTLEGISGLTKEQLFAEPVKGEYPIGAYLMHLGEADLGWLRRVSGEKQPDDLKKKNFYGAWFDVPENLYNPPKEPLEPAEYTEAITESRKRLLDYLDSLSDEDLGTIIKIKTSSKGEIERSKKWVFYHLIEHEAHTRGQMFLLMRMAGFKKKGENNI